MDARLEADIAAAQIRRLTADAERLERENVWNAVQSAETGIYTFADDVTADSVTDAICELDVISRRKPGADLVIYFNTNGGSVFDGMALYDFIVELRGRGHHVTTVALGAVFSMGSILLQAGTKREMARHSYMMIHEIATDTGYVKASGLRDEVKLLDRLERQALAVLAERSTMTAEEIKVRMDRKDWFLDAAETVAHGFADAIRGAELGESK